MPQTTHQKTITFSYYVECTETEESYIIKLLTTFLAQILVYHLSTDEEKDRIRIFMRPQYQGFKLLLGHEFVKNFPKNWITHMYEDIKIFSFSFSEELQKSKGPLFPIEFPYSIDQIHKIFIPTRQE